MIRAKKQSTEIEKIMEKVRRMGYSQEHLFTKSKIPEYVTLRRSVWMVLLTHYTWTTEEISSCFDISQSNITRGINKLRSASDFEVYHRLMDHVCKR